MTAETAPAPRGQALPSVLGPIRPRPRWTELRLLGLVAITLVVGSVSLAATVDGHFRLYDAQGLGIYLVALLVAHVAQVLAGRRTDQILLPTIGLLGGISLLLMERLPQDLVSQTFFGTTLGLAQVQLVWLLISLAVMTTLAIVVRSDSWLRRYKYTWAAAGVGLLLLTFVLGTEINGQRLTIQLGPLSGQPTELLKVILVVFLAGYLSENRALLVEQDTRVGPLRLPPVPYLGTDGRDVGDRSRDRRHPEGPRRGAAVLRRLPRDALHRNGTDQPGHHRADPVRHRERTDGRPDRPRADPGGRLDRPVRRPARRWLPGRPGAPCVRPRRASRGRAWRWPPRDRRQAADPQVHTDFPLAALGEELGVLGVVAILGLYLVVVERGLRIGAAAADDFRSLLAVGLALVIGIQAFIIAAGDLKVLPLTGVTLPFISYGGSSLLANALVIGLLLALSDKGVEPPPLPRVSSRWRRISRRGAA